MDAWLQAAKDWLEREGYPFEMHVANVLAQQTSTVNQGIFYVDEITKKGREIDVSARFLETIPEAGAAVSVTLLIECKYSKSKPWLLLTRHASQAGIRDVENTPADKLGTNLLLNMPPAVLFDGPPSEPRFFRGPSTSSYACVSAHRERNAGRDQAYDGPLGAASAAHALSASHRPSILDLMTDRSTGSLWIPMVVLDGNLASASLRDGRMIEMDPLPWGRLRVTNPEVGPRSTMVDIVTIEYLPDYVRLLRSDLRKLVAAIRVEPKILKEEFFGLKDIIGKGPVGE